MKNHWPQELVSAKTPQSITYIFRTFLSKTAVYTLFSSAHERFSRIEHMLGYKTNLHKFKNKVIQNIFFSHHSVKLEINYKRKLENVELKQHATEQQRGRRRNKKKIFFNV